MVLHPLHLLLHPIRCMHMTHTQNNLQALTDPQIITVRKQHYYNFSANKAKIQVLHKQHYYKFSAITNEIQVLTTYCKGAPQYNHETHSSVHDLRCQGHQQFQADQTRPLAAHRKHFHLPAQSQHR